MALAPDSDLWKYYDNIIAEGVAECKLCKQRLKNNRSYNLKLHIKKVHLNRAEIDKYFIINLLNNTAVCRTCNQQLQNRLCNIRLHMRRLHNIEIKLPEDKAVETPPSPQPYNEDQIQAVLKVAKRKMAEQAASSEKRPTHRMFIRMDKRTVVRSVMGLIVEDNISPHILSSKHFDAILGPMCDSISDKQGREFKMNAAEIERIINLIANSIRTDFSNDLSSRLLTIKIDNDIGAWHHVFCVRAMFIDDGEIQSRTLGLIDLKDDSQQLQEDHIKQILHKFNIDSNQIISVFWDNTKSKYKNQVQNAEYLQEIEMFQSYPELYLGEAKIEPYLSSSAQLCLLNILKDVQILEPILECRNLVKFLNDKANGYFELFDSKKITLPQLDSPWNAGSTCKMMNDLWEARSLLQTVKFENPQEDSDKFNCSKDLWSFIEAFSKSTNYLQKTILKYYNDEFHIGDFYAQWLKCKLLTEKFSAANINSNNFFSTILRNILKSIEIITDQLLEEERVTACLYLDPRFQRLLNEAQKTIASEYLKRLWCRSKLYVDDDTALKNDAAQLFDDDEDAFLNEFLSQDLHVKDRSSNDVLHKIEGLALKFQTADTNILSFWRGLKTTDPEVYTLSTICFAIPATQIYTKTHYTDVYPLNANSEMSTFTKDNLLCLRLNAHLLDESLTHLELIDDEQSIRSFNSSDNEADSSEVFEEENSNAASTLTTMSGGVSKFSNVDVQPTITDAKVERSI